MGTAVWLAILVFAQIYPELEGAEIRVNNLTGINAHLFRQPLRENSVTCVGSEFDIERIRKPLNDLNKDPFYNLMRLNLTDKKTLRPKEMSEFVNVIYEPEFVERFPDIKMIFEKCVQQYKNSFAETGKKGRQQRHYQFWDCIDPKNVKTEGNKFCKELDDGIARSLDKWGKCVKVVPKLKENAIKCVESKLDIGSATNFIENEYFLGKSSPETFLRNLNVVISDHIPNEQNLRDFREVLFDPTLLKDSPQINKKYLQCVDTFVLDYQLGIDFEERSRFFVNCIQPKNFLSEGQEICNPNSPPTTPEPASTTVEPTSTTPEPTTPTPPPTASTPPPTTPTAPPTIPPVTAAQPDPTPSDRYPLLDTLLERLSKSPGPAIDLEWFRKAAKKSNPDYDTLLSILRGSGLNLENLLREHIAGNVDWNQLLSLPGGADLGWVILLETATRKVKWVPFFKKQTKQFNFSKHFGKQRNSKYTKYLTGLQDQTPVNWLDIVPKENGGSIWQAMLAQVQKPNPDWYKILNSTGEITADQAQLLSKYIFSDLDSSDLLSTPGGRKAAWLMLLQQATGKFDFKKEFGKPGVTVDPYKWLEQGLGPNEDLAHVLYGVEAINWPKVLSENGGQGLNWDLLIQSGKETNPDWSALVQSAKSADLDFKAVEQKGKLEDLEQMASQPGGKELALLFVLQRASGIIEHGNISTTHELTGDIVHVQTRKNRPTVTLRVPASESQPRV